VRVLLLAVLVLSLAACHSPGADEPEPSDTPSATPTTPEPSRGLPPGVEPAPRSAAGVVVGEDGLIHVVTFGSSSNPAIVREVRAEGQTVTADVRNVPDRPATMDFVPTTSAFVLPTSVDPDRPVTVVLGDLGTVRLASAAPGTQAWVRTGD